MSKTPIDEEIQNKIGSLDDKIKDARDKQKAYKKKQYGEEKKVSKEELMGNKAASMFLGNVLAGLIIGIIVDKFMSSFPLGIMIFIILGFVAGVFRAQDIIKKNE